MRSCESFTSLSYSTSGQYAEANLLPSHHQTGKWATSGPNECYSTQVIFHSPTVTDLTFKVSFHIKRIACASMMAKATAYQKDDSHRMAYYMPWWYFCTIICTSIQLWGPGAPEGGCVQLDIVLSSPAVLYSNGKGQKSLGTKAIGFPSLSITGQGGNGWAMDVVVLHPAAQTFMPLATKCNAQRSNYIAS